MTQNTQHGDHMIAVVDRKLVKHLFNTDRGRLEVHIRISFQYDLVSGRFVAGSTERQMLYNDSNAPPTTGQRCDALPSDIDIVVDQMLTEHLCYSSHATTEGELYKKESNSFAEPKTRV